MKCARAFVLGVMFIIAALTQAMANFERFSNPRAAAGITPRDIVSQRDVTAETQLYCMALAVYFEGGSTAESEDGQRHIARVVHERAKANRRKWGGSDICNVVFYMRKGVCQFSFACLPTARRTPRFGAAWTYSKSIAEDELEGRSAISERSTRYYMNAALTPLRNACRFRREFVKVAEAGRHEFFREPTDAEFAELAKAEFIECIRYAEALKRAEEARVLKAAKKKRLAALAKKKKKLGSVKLATR